jgi:hypothetical protein
MAKLLAAEATWHAAEATFATYGGFAFAKEYDIERKWREARLYQTAPISTNLILALYRPARIGDAAILLNCRVAQGASRMGRAGAKPINTPRNYPLCHDLALPPNREKLA